MKRIILAISIMILGTTIHAQDVEMHVQFSTMHSIDTETNKVKNTVQGISQLHVYNNEIVVSGVDYVWTEKIRIRTNDGSNIAFNTIDNTWYFVFYNSEYIITSIRIVSEELDAVIVYSDRSYNVKVPQKFLNLPNLYK